MVRAAGLLVAALLAGGAIAGAASAQKSGLAARMGHSSRAFSLPGHRFGPGFGNFRRRLRHSGFGRRFRHGGFRHRGRFFGDGAVLAYGGFDDDPGYAEDDSEDSGRDSGFFYGEGGVRTRGGQALYAYDRSYPYDWYRGAAAGPAAPRLAMRDGAPRSVHCQSEHGVRVCRGD
jgi:hypothetical protein